ncbi:transposase [Streptomyces sp. XD-27]|nr:transposase [Streptomyces sp. XD-27]WKX74561.1 transposase [Streptomyces sp. XD-27]
MCKVGNCQIGVSLHAASDTVSCPLSWRLFLPPSWDGPQAADRRDRCRIPDTEHHRPKWHLALEMLDELAALGLRPAVVVADTGYGANADFRHALDERGLAYALQVKGELTAHAEEAVPYQPPYGGLGPRPLPRYRTRPVSLREHVLAAGRESPCQGLTLYQALGLLQHLIATWTGTCPTCHQPTPWQPYDTT